MQQRIVYICCGTAAMNHTVSHARTKTGSTIWHTHVVVSLAMLAAMRAPASLDPSV